MSIHTISIHSKINNFLNVDERKRGNFEFIISLRINQSSVQKTTDYFTGHFRCISFWTKRRRYLLPSREWIIRYPKFEMDRNWGIRKVSARVSSFTWKMGLILYHGCKNEKARSLNTDWTVVRSCYSRTFDGKKRVGIRSGRVGRSAETWRPPTSRRSNASADIDVHPFEVRTRRVVALHRIR